LKSASTGPITDGESILDDYIGGDVANHSCHQFLGIGAARAHSDGAQIVFWVPLLELADHGLLALTVFIERYAPHDDIALGLGRAQASEKAEEAEQVGTLHRSFHFIVL
jgi:hypothetical protein